MIFKKRNLSFRSYLLRIMIILSITSLLAMGCFWIISEYNSFKDREVTLKQNFINAQKERITFEVSNALDFITYNQTLTEERLKNNIKARVNEAHAIATNLYEKNKGKSQKELESLIKEALRPIRYNNGRGYYFAVSMDGIEKLYPVAPQFEDQNLLDLQDEKGNYVIKQEIATIKEHGEGFVRDYWRKPNASDEMIYPKITYVKYFEPLDWYLGSGEYLDDVEKDIQKESLERLSQIRFGKNGTIIVTRYDGQPLIAHGRLVETTINMWNQTDDFGTKIIQKELEIIKESGKGFVESYWTRPSSELTEKKITYIVGFEEWKWIIGAGFYVSDIQYEINQLRTDLEKKVKENIQKIFFILLLITASIFLIGSFIFRRINKNFKVFQKFFHKAVHTSTKIDKTKLDFEEFKMMADAANNMTCKKNEALQLLQESKEKYRQLVSNLGEGVLVFDNDRNFLFANKAAEFIFGLSEKELIRKNLADFIIETDETLEDNELEIKNARGKTRLLRVTKTDRFNAKNEIVGTFEIFHDVTESKKLELERNENRERLKLINKILRHDLANDLSVIRSAVRLYEENSKQDYLKEIEKRVKKAISTIDMVRKQESFLNRRTELFELDLNSIIDSIKDRYSQINIDVKGRGAVFADEVLHSVFENIVSNSITHGKATEIVVDITEQAEFFQIKFIIMVLAFRMK